MPRDPAQVDDELVALVGEASHAPEAEVRAALAGLSQPQQKTLRRALRANSDELSPQAWADLARGASTAVVQARELSGFYSLKAERDALAAMVGAGAARDPASAGLATSGGRQPISDEEPRSDKRRGRRTPEREREPAGRSRREPVRSLVAEEEPEPSPTAKEARRSRGVSKRSKETAPQAARAQELLGLFAYHRDAPLVARALKLSLSELLEELDALKIRRAAFRLTRGVDADFPRATALPGTPLPSVRKRKKDAAPPREPAPKSERDLQQEQLKALLAEIGPRRRDLAARLGGDGAPLSEAALLARFRSAGLERELSLRERDLVRALYQKHRGSEVRVAEELHVDVTGLRRMVAERGLGRELDAVRQEALVAVRNKPWPRERILQLLENADDLKDLGVYDDTLAEVSARTQVIWKSLAGKPDAQGLLAKKLRLERDEAVRLQRFLRLR
jgi:hypothetical protein